MLTSQQMQLRIKVIIILTSIAFASLITGTVIMIISESYGFSISSPFTCLAANGNYFVLKYTTNNQFLSASFVGILLAVLCTLIILILLIPPLVKISKTLNKKAEEPLLETLQKMMIAVYIILSLGVLGTLIPMSYAASILIEVSSKCNLAVEYKWPTIMATTGLALILLIIAYLILLKTRIQRTDQKKQETKPLSTKDKKQSNEVQKAVEGEIVNSQNQQKVPLLDKQNTGQVPKVMNEHFQTVTQKNEFQPSIIRPTQNSETYNNTPPQQTVFQKPEVVKKPAQNKNKQIVQQKQPTQSLPKFHPPIDNPSKIQIKPDTSQSVTTINFNFPNVLPGLPISNQSPSLAGYGSHDNFGKHQQRRNGKKQKRQVIKQSREEELSSDSDDHYYKRARKTKRKFQENSNMKNSKKKRNIDVDYQRDYQKNPSRFNASPSEPKYVVLSPESFKTFYDFVKNDHQKLPKKNKRNFAPSPERGLKRTDDLSKSEVKIYTQQKHLNQTQQQKRQFSIYHKLDASRDSDNQNQIKKYQPFFKSSRLLQRQTPSGKDSELDEYFNILNSYSGRKVDQDGQNGNYHSISNYSSVLNEQNKGKIPVQREANSQNRVNLEQKKIHSIKSKQQKKSIIDQIRNRYN